MRDPQRQREIETYGQTDRKRLLHPDRPRETGSEKLRGKKRHRVGHNQTQTKRMNEREKKK